MAKPLSIEALGDTEKLGKSVEELISDTDAVSGARQIRVSIPMISFERTTEEIVLNLSTVQRLVATYVAQESANDKAHNNRAHTILQHLSRHEIIVESVPLQTDGPVDRRLVRMRPSHPIHAHARGPIALFVA